MNFLQFHAPLRETKMLAKVIKLSNEKGGKVSVKSVLDYLSRDEVEGAAKDVMDYAARDSVGMPRIDTVEGGTFNLEELSVSDPMDRDLTVRMMDYISKAGQEKTYFKTNPIYHYVLSWREGEHPDEKQVRDAVSHTLKELGLHENQSFYVIHRDKESHHHVHVIANRVHPEKLTLSGPPRFDYLVLDKACRVIENTQGWTHDNGPYVVQGDEIKRLTKAQRKELGLASESDLKNHAPTPAARMYEVKNGTESFASWSRKEVAPDLVKLIQSENPSWEKLHLKLAEFGIKAEQKGGGLTLTTEKFGKETSTKSSGLDYRLSLGRLEKQLGAYQPPKAIEAIKPIKSFEYYVNNVHAGKVSDIPQTGKGSPKREEQRMARLMKREELASRYKTELNQAKEPLRIAREELKNSTISQREQVKQRLAQIKPERINELTNMYGSKQIAKSIFASEKVIEIQKVEELIKAQKTKLSKQNDMSWPAWLERQAEKGDDAAISALKGINYSEQRKKNKARPGFEGEDLELVKAEEQEANSIGGDKKFKLANAQIEIDQERRRVIYRDYDGNARLIDTGNRVDVLKRDDKDSIKEGLLLSKQKFGGEVYITGDAQFREKAAREAARMNITVADKDLQNVIKDEKQKIQNSKVQER